MKIDLFKEDKRTFVKAHLKLKTNRYSARELIKVFNYYERAVQHRRSFEFILEPVNSCDDEACEYSFKTLKDFTDWFWSSEEVDRRAKRRREMNRVMGIDPYIIW